MPRKLPKSLTDAKRDSVWEDLRDSGTRRFLASPLRVSSSDSGARHFTGGKSKYKGSNCRECRKPLALLWDLDLGDNSIPDCVRDGFAPATRLPFLICWQCLATSYIVRSDDKIETFKFDVRTDNLNPGDSPFLDAPEVLERRPISLTTIPTSIDALFTLADMIGYVSFDASAKHALTEFLGEAVDSDWDLPISQLGGTPLASQGHSNAVCPNRKCPASKLEHPYGEMMERYLMKELGLINWKDEPILAEHCFQMMYYVCTVCFSIRGEYRSS